MSVLDQLERHVEPEPNSSCWIWVGCRFRGGYGNVRIGGGKNGKNRLAHRVMYELVRGPIPDGMTLDHICRVRSCVNPAHLEPVTNRVNVLRGEGITARASRVTHCRQGHPYNETHTLLYRGRRYCYTCIKNRAPETRRRRFAAATTRPCLCGCGQPVKTITVSGSKRVGWAIGHNLNPVTA